VTEGVNLTAWYLTPFPTGPDSAEPLAIGRCQVPTSLPTVEGEGEPDVVDPENFVTATLPGEGVGGGTVVGGGVGGTVVGGGVGGLVVGGGVVVGGGGVGGLVVGGGVVVVGGGVGGLVVGAGVGVGLVGGGDGGGLEPHESHAPVPFEHPKSFVQ
jgi:hypothetical protein